MSDPVAIALISMVGSFLAASLSLANNVLGRRNSRDIAETKEAMVELEKNTNSKFDQLVKLTDTEAFARGQKHGEDNPR